MYSGKTKEDFYYELEKIGISNLYVLRTSSKEKQAQDEH